MKTFIGILVIGVVSFSNAFAQRQTMRIDEASQGKMQEYLRIETQRQKAHDQLRVTRSDWFQRPKLESPSSGTIPCFFNDEEMKNFADAVDASRGEAGMFHTLPLIDQTRKIGNQCNDRMRPSGLRKKPAPKAFHAMDE